jgi:hypothetical protein
VEALRLVFDFSKVPQSRAVSAVGCCRWIVVAVGLARVVSEEKVARYDDLVRLTRELADVMPEDLKKDVLIDLAMANDGHVAAMKMLSVTFNVLAEDSCRGNEELEEICKTLAGEWNELAQLHEK